MKAISEGINTNTILRERFHEREAASPLPRAYQWADGSAYVNHVALVRQARGAKMPESFWTDPLMYQGGSDVFLGPRDAIPLKDEAWGCDFEAEVAVIVDDVEMGVTPAAAQTASRVDFPCVARVQAARWPSTRRSTCALPVGGIVRESCCDVRSAFGTDTGRSRSPDRRRLSTLG